LLARDGRLSYRNIANTIGMTTKSGFASGLYDIDLQLTPATNSLPINRCGLKDGDSQQIQVLWIGFPGLILEQQEQIYSKINNRLYKFEIPSTCFEKRLLVDELGLVIDYDNLWHRLN
jgi:uncharacterized protein